MRQPEETHICTKELEDSPSYLQILPYQIGDNTILQITTEDGHTHTIEHEPFPYLEDGESDFTDMGLGTNQWTTRKLENGHLEVTHHRNGSETPTSIETHNPKDRAFYFVRIIKSTNKDIEGRVGFPVGAFRVNNPTHIVMGPCVTRMPNVTHIKGSNVEKDEVTDRTIEFLRENFHEALTSEAHTGTVQTEVLKKCRCEGDEEKSPEEIAGEIAALHQIVTVAIAIVFNEIKENELHKRFTAEQLKEMNEVLGAFVDNYGGYISGMMGIGRKTFKAKSKYRKKSYEITSSTSPYRGEQIGFSIEAVPEKEQIAQSRLGRLFSKVPFFK